MLWELLVQAEAVGDSRIEVNSKLACWTQSWRNTKEMTQMKKLDHALNKIEFLLTKRQLVYYLLSVGMPTAFYLFFSGCTRTTGGPSYFITRLPHLHDGFFHDVRQLSFHSQLFYIPIKSTTGENITYTPVNMVEYYLSKITSMIVDYLVSILVVCLLSWALGQRCVGFYTFRKLVGGCALADSRKCSFVALGWLWLSYLLVSWCLSNGSQSSLL